MTEAATATTNRPAWIDMSSSDVQAAGQFYGRVFGWSLDVNPDPQYGGYGLARLAGKDVAGIGPKQSPDQPTAWSLYIGTDDLEALSKRVLDAGGTVIAPAFDVGDQGRMAVFQDPVGAFISAWQPTQMGGFQTNAPNSYGWAELNARGIDKARRFYEDVFGWTTRTTGGEGGTPQYTEFQQDGQSIAGGQEMFANVPADVPSYWMIYFTVEDVDRSFQSVLDAGGREMVSPSDFPGGRFAVVSDPEGAMFGLLRMAPA